MRESSRKTANKEVIKFAFHRSRSLLGFLAQLVLLAGKIIDLANLNFSARKGGKPEKFEVLLNFLTDFPLMTQNLRRKKRTSAKTKADKASRQAYLVKVTQRN